MYINQSTLFLGTSMDFVKRFMEEDPDDGIIFLKQLAATLGNRLLETYKMIAPKKSD